MAKADQRHIHDGDHDHSHHDHSHIPSDFNRAFAIGVSLNVLLVIAQAAYGYWSHSLALVADAGHNLGDVLGLIMAWVASRLATRKPSAQFTYGLKSSSILAALMNAVILLVATGGIAWEAILRFGEDTPVDGKTVIWVALLGVVVNAGSAALFLRGRKGDLNVRGAFLHLVADALVSVGVAISGVLVIWTGLHWIDAAASLLICLTIVWSAWGLLRESVALALHAVPKGVDASKIKAFLEGEPGIDRIHDLHIWGMSTTETALTCHLVMPKSEHSRDTYLHELARKIEAQFEIQHVTLQVESGDSSVDCPLEDDDVV